MISGKAAQFAPDNTGRLHYLHHDHQSFSNSFQERCRLCFELWTEFESDVGRSASDLANAGFILLFVVFPIQSSTGAIAVLWQFNFYVKPTLVSQDLLRNRFLVERGPLPRSYEAGAEKHEPVFYSSFTLTPNQGRPDTRGEKAIGGVSRSPQSLALIDRWVDDCVRNHADCKPWRDYIGDRTPPTRVIDVGVKGSPNTVYLRSVAELSVQGQFNETYVTLSHKWGSAAHPKLTEKTYFRMSRGISASNFPKSFRNAVAVTRQLNVRYLWIDSLCILQDSTEDWLREGAKMDKIYEYGILNIAATAGEDSDGGLFFDRDPLLVQPLQESMPWPIYQSSETAQASGIEPSSGRLFYWVSQTFWKKHVEDAILNTRAWVMQERFLSPRVLHCSKTQLLWECKTKRACESFPESFITPLGRQPGERPTKVLDRMGRQSGWLFYAGGKVEYNPPNDEHLIDEAYRAWMRVVTDYSSCNITRESDLLIAFSGIAKKFQSRLNDRYLAGLLESRLHFQLMWYTTDRDAMRPSMSRKKFAWRAPSWSWASVTGKISWDPGLLPAVAVRDERSDAIMFDLVERNIEPVGSDPCGQLASAWLKVRGTIVALSGFLNDVITDADFVRSWGPRARHVWLKAEEKDYMAVAQFDDEAIIQMLLQAEPSGHLDIFSLPILATKIDVETNKGKRTQTLRIEGLLLHLFGDDVRHPSGFSRIGKFLFTVNDDETLLDYFQKLRSSDSLREYTLL
jgi:Heterokaryon incompatibility protein (HET)